MEDIRLGRRMGPQAGAVSIAAGSPQQIVGPDPNRVRLTISGNGVATLFFGFDGAPVANGIGFCIPPQVGMVTLTVEEWGRLVTSPVTVAISAGTATVIFNAVTLGDQ